MNAFARVLAVCALALIFPACLPFAIFEDVGSDPHPPTVEVLGLAVQPPEPSGDEPAVQPVFLPADGFVVRPLDQGRNVFILKVRFTDAGGDVVKISLRDLDGPLSTDATPAAPQVDVDGDGDLDTLEVPEFLPGTFGEATMRDLRFEVNQQGPHRIQVWAEDSHESRSEKQIFTVEVILFR